MSEVLTRIKFAAVGVVSLVIFAAAMFVGLTDGGPGPFKAFALATLITGAIFINATIGHDLPDRLDTAILGLYTIFGLGVIAIEVVVNDYQLSRADIGRFGTSFAAVAAIAGWMYLADRDAE